MVYYKYELNEDGVIIAIHSSETLFEENQITLGQAKQVKLGKTKPSDINN